LTGAMTLVEYVGVCTPRPVEYVETGL
jgi:hypothetical protein